LRRFAEGRAVTSPYVYELVGLAYYVLFLIMGSARHRARFSARSRVLTLIAAIALVGCVPGGYAAKPLGIAMMLAFAAIAMLSSLIDARRP
jgi:hypothetical protein